MQPARNLSEVTVKIVNGKLDDGRDYTNLLHGWTENGQRRNASSRIGGYVADTPMNRAFHVEAFKRRQAR